MPKFRKKPTVVEAEQFLFEDDCLPEDFPLPFKDRQACRMRDDGTWYVITAHGQETNIVLGDWIIAEPDGRGFYPCKPDIFQAIYESVDPLPATAHEERLAHRTSIKTLRDLFHRWRPTLAEIRELDYEHLPIEEFFERLCKKREAETAIAVKPRQLDVGG